MLDDAVDQILATPGEFLSAFAEHERQAAILALTARQLETTGAWMADGSVSMAAWMRTHLKIGEVAAKQFLARARFLDTFPAFAEAILDGSLSTGQVDALRSTVVRRVEPVVHDQQHELVESLSGLSLVDTEFACAEWRERADAIIDGAEPREEQRRELSFVRAGDNKLVGKLVLDDYGATEFEKAIANAITHDGTDETRSHQERQGDALVDICAFFNHNHLGDGSPRHLPHVTITVDADDLSDRPAGINNDTDRPMTSGCTDSYLCDCKIHTVLRDPHSGGLTFGREQYLVPRALFRQIAARDGGCRFPGCNRPVRFTEAHHITYWRHGGRTNYDNLVLLCSRHHHYVHQHNLHLVLVTNGDLTVTWVDGRHTTSRPRGRPPRPPG